MSQISVTEFRLASIQNEPRVSTVELASKLGIEARALHQTVDKYPEDFEAFGRVAFEMQPLQTAGGVQKIRVTYLNEDQAYLLLTYAQNTPEARACKVALISAFRSLRDAPVYSSDPLTAQIEMLLATRRAQTALEYRMADVESARAIELELTPINSLEVGQIHKAVTTIARVGQIKHAVVWGAFKERYAIASYRDLPRSKFAEALKWLNGWYAGMAHGELL